MHKNASINTTGSIIISIVSNLYLGSFFIGALFEVADSILTPAMEVLALVVLFKPSATLLFALVFTVLFELSATLLFAFTVTLLSEFTVSALFEFITVELSDKFSFMLKTSFSFRQVHIPVYPQLDS